MIINTFINDIYINMTFCTLLARPFQAPPVCPHPPLQLHPRASAQVCQAVCHRAHRV